MKKPKSKNRAARSCAPSSGSSLGCVVESMDGLVHMVTFSEYTLCGDALEGDHEAGHIDYIPSCERTSRSVITCPKCCEIISEAKRMKCKPNDPSSPAGSAPETVQTGEAQTAPSQLGAAHG